MYFWLHKFFICTCLLFDMYSPMHLELFVSWHCSCFMIVMSLNFLAVDLWVCLTHCKVNLWFLNLQLAVSNVLGLPAASSCPGLSKCSVDTRHCPGIDKQLVDWLAWGWSWAILNISLVSPSHLLLLTNTHPLIHMYMHTHVRTTQHIQMHTCTHTCTHTTHRHTCTHTRTTHRHTCMHTNNTHTHTCKHTNNTHTHTTW